MRYYNSTIGAVEVFNNLNTRQVYTRMQAFLLDIGISGQVEQVEKRR